MNTKENDKYSNESECLGKNGTSDIIKQITSNLSDRLFDESHQYTFVKATVNAKGLYQSQKCLSYARRMHDGATRKGTDAVPYIAHPLTLACHALSLHIYDDNIISAALLHDVCEDCDVLVDELPVNEATRDAVRLLTKTEHPDMTSDEYLKKYYEDISQNKIASIVKLLDRCNNVSGMASCFSREKLAEYIIDTEQYIYPLFKSTSNQFPEIYNQIFLINYHTVSVVEAIKHML